MKTTLVGEKQNSNMQEMAEVREPMASDCWADAQRLAGLYAEKFQRDFWILFAAKPHTHRRYAAVMGWHVVIRRPKEAMVGVMVFKWVHKDKRLTVETDLSLPYDVPIEQDELSTSKKDFVPSVEQAAKKSGSILLA